MHGHTPSGDSGLSLGNVAAPVDHGVITQGSCWIPGSWISRWRTTRLLSSSLPCSPYFSIALTMSCDSRTTREHKTPESNKSVKKTSVSQIRRIHVRPHRCLAPVCWDVGDMQHTQERFCFQTFSHLGARPRRFSPVTFESRSI
jgi:hypothetical protein